MREVRGADIPLPPPLRGEGVAADGPTAKPERWGLRPVRGLVIDDIKEAPASAGRR
jgi:hypothetical protein